MRKAKASSLQARTRVAKSVDQKQKLDQLQKENELLYGVINAPAQRTIIEGFGKGIVS